MRISVTCLWAWAQAHNHAEPMVIGAQNRPHGWAGGSAHIENPSESCTVLVSQILHVGGEGQVCIKWIDLDVVVLVGCMGWRREAN